VIQQADVDELQRRFQAPGDPLVRLAGLGHPGRVVVGDDDRCRIAGQRLLDDLARVDAGPVDRTAEELVEAEYPVAVVEEETAEELVRQIAEPGFQEPLGVRRTLQRLANDQAGLEVSSRELRNGLENRRADGAYAENLLLFPGLAVFPGLLEWSDTKRYESATASSHRCRASSGC